MSMPPQTARDTSAPARRALIALGANAPAPQGGPASSLRAAMGEIAALGRDARCSRLWRSPAFPAGSGPDFVNAAMALDTPLSAPALLEALHAIEARFGRERQRRWGPRSLDLDLLAHGEEVLPDRAEWARWRDLPLERQMQETPKALILPHPRLQDRGFVLLPLAEVAPDWRHPVTELTVTRMRDGLPAAAQEGLEPID
ncbi:2-amino-4-hydroxy-6-hydroxymethyldihydropteridine diphosphokinase [Limimaricola litoreus]|uniref:2-amino-4-hydroxy-6-hydroxymethyldihydropteridine pyrophosphokinase n=1 Tax=Limimaricola litoreus TaxID=2955316 RepID=A0A9X2FR26_9RHOB|nr:2-amino-4-hydroxy-6-hydroxymethyldihydropteridine diphosphokinase [Limimaricola litoreus]MCP1170096.1 2-amino-4-hydroxy-6-hydroxymethyldihydropteridine diphosphokinase [Limimaricola litoreus]